ncbi:endonuclease/exonuclease/phosphatase family protein [Kaistella montana]|uniref:Endonuclease/exonuclease/phosphatase family protein n=1 Tax=Kaistella montana TaxID=1849733 RepID=A0ABW5K6U5_9FLAO|nr:endonuclease/exonuclease/phosphatase family protein [Kaistella montana]MCQ4034226.1 endonuclease/exonuclease/phosphatase family protein [Kaistella montana]
MDAKELIAFYNVENLFSPDPPQVHKLDPTLSGLRNWDERRYQNKLFKIAHVFQLIQEAENTLPFLIGLSEIQGQKPLEDLIAMEPFNSNFGVVHYDSMDERGVDVALLYDKSKVEIISSEPITYFFEIEDNNPANYDTTRDVLFCKVKYLGEIINLFVLHLPSKREKDVNKPKRDYIMNDVRQKVSDIISEKKEAVIICGDFNENPTDDNLIKLQYDYNSEKIMTNPYLDLYQNQNFSTYHYKDGLLFDQIIFSPQFFATDFPLKFAAAKVFNHIKLSNYDKKFAGRPFRTYAGTRYLGGYSDHFPVIVEFKK